MRRYRLDVAYLGWVLQSVGRCSALAIMLLGLSPNPASAKIAPFTSSGILLGGAGRAPDYGAPSLGDLDGDGDLDLLVGERIGTFHYYENNGGPLFSFVERTGTANPLNGVNLDERSTPAFVDLDRDGDLDVVAGDRGTTFRLFENTGSATNPAFVQRTGAANPFEGVEHEIGDFPTPAFGDLDADGDFDLVAGSVGFVFVLENSGDATNPAFGQPQLDPSIDLSGVGYATPALADLDGDGDLDLVVGSFSGGLLLFENTGNASTVSFVARTGSASPLDVLDLGSYSAPALADLDGDGDPDIVVGEADEDLNFVRNDAHSLLRRTGSANPLEGLTVGSFPAPTLGDLDDDGDFDLVSGDDNGTFHYFENMGSRTSPVFLARTGFDNPFVLVDVGSYTTPVLADLDGDGDLDLVSGEGQRGVFEPLNYFENTGTPTSPAFIQRTGSANPLSGALISSVATAPALGDLDGDGDLDLLIGEKLAGQTPFFEFRENIGSATNPVFASSSFDPFYRVTPPTSAYRISFADLDGDGDLDIAADDTERPFFQNTGSPRAPAFAEGGYQIGIFGGPTSFVDLDADGDVDGVTGRDGPSGDFVFFENFLTQLPTPARRVDGAANPLAGADVGSLAAPALADLDSDGDADLLAGNDVGIFQYFENTGGATSPVFVARTGANNPLGDHDVGDAAKPAFADLDGDGDFDLLAGRLAGDFAYFENSGDATTPQFVAVVANPFGLTSIGGDGSAPIVADLDLDGDLDLAVGGAYGRFSYFENTGTRTSPSFVERFWQANPLDNLDLFGDSTAALADFDGDGDVDLVCGMTGGRLLYTPDVALWAYITGNPHFVPMSGSVSPLAGQDVGSYSTPAAADLDGDGHPDLVSGSLAGTFTVYYMPEPSGNLLLGSGIALIAWIRRLRVPTRAKATSLSLDDLGV